MALQNSRESWNGSFVVGEESASRSSRRPNVQALQRTDTRKIIRESLPPDRWLRPTKHGLHSSAEPDHRAINWSPKDKVLRRNPNAVESACKGLIPSCRNRGRIWGHSLIGAQYCCGFRRPDVCPIPPAHPRCLRFAPGEFGIRSRGASIRESNGWSSLAEAGRGRRNDRSRESSCRSRSYRKMIILRYSGIKTLVQ